MIIDEYRYKRINDAMLVVVNNGRIEIMIQSVSMRLNHEQFEYIKSVKNELKYYIL